MLTHGVISNDKLVYSLQYSNGRKQLFTVPLPSGIPLYTYLELALQHDLHTLWVAPGCPLNYWTEGQAASGQGWDIKASTIRHPIHGLPPILRGVTANRTTGSWAEKRRITVTFPQWSTYAWSEEELPGCSDPVACLAGIHYLQQVLGMELHHNAGVQGRQLIEATNSTHSRPAWVARPSMDMMPFKQERKAGYDLKYIRGIDPVDVAGLGELFLLALDKNSQYLGACSSVELGTGNPVYVGAPELEMDYEGTMKRWYDGKRPGYWRVDIEEFLHPLYPLHRGQEWITTPLLKLLYGMGARLTVREAWVWPEHHRILKDFGTKLWEARQSLKNDTVKYPHAIGKAIAYHSIKRIATAGVGLLSSEDTAKYSPEWFRPDWRDAVVEEAKARLVFKLLQVEREYGALPLMVKVDCVYYLTHAPTPEQAFPGMFGNADKLGGWKVEHSLPASYAVLDCFKAGNTPGGASGKLKKLVAGGVR